MPVKLENSYTPPVDTGILDAPLSEPSFGEAFRATFAYQYQPLIDQVEESGRFAYRDFDAEFDPFAQAAGYEEYLDQIARAKDQEHLDYIKNNIDERLYEKDILTRAGISAGTVIASLLDPLNIAFALPVFGQLGLLAKGGMTVRQAALASARGGFVTGAASELIRAPFDKTSTDVEVVNNLLATTAFGGALGSIPAVARAGINYARKTKAMRDAQFEGRGSLPNAIDGFSINRTEAPVIKGKPKAGKFHEIDKAIDAAETAKADVAATRKNRDAAFEKIDADLASGKIDQATARKLKLESLELSAFNAAKKRLKDADNAVNDVINAENKKLRKAVSVKGKTINIDDELLDIEFNKRPWTQPEVEGATPLRETDFLTPEQWGEFSVMKEIVKAQNKRKRGESKAAYVDRVNKIALDRSRSGRELEETPLTRTNAWRMLSTPSKRILEDGDNTMKEFVHRVVGVDHISTQNLAKGQASSQSINRRAKTHIGRFVGHRNKMMDLWSKDQLGRSQSTRIFGYNTDNIVAKWNNAKTFDEWYEAVNEARLVQQAGQFNKYDSTFSKDFRAAMREVDAFFSEYKLDLQHYNLLATTEALQTKRARARLDIEYYENMQKDRGLTKGQEMRLDRLRDQEAFYDDLIKNSITESYTLPIYYDKAKLSADPALRERLVAVFEEWIRNNPILSVWDEKAGKFVTIDPKERADPRITAENAVASIMEEGDPITIGEMNGVPKGKHLRHRQINIPEYLISDFIIKDSRIARSYSARVGKRIEWARQFGNQTIEDILDDAEVRMRESGMDEKKIVSLRADMAFEYERVMGEHLKDPSRWDAQTARVIKESTGIAYLDTAAYASVTDAGMIVMERGFGKIYQGLRSEVDRNMLRKNAKLIPATGERTELALGGAQQRLIADNIDGLEPTAVERILNPITRAYYNIPILGNGLGTVTHLFKTIDGSYRASDLMEHVVNMANGTIKEADARYLLRMGISESDAKIMAKLPYEKGDNILHPNIDKWPNKTKAEREIVLKWNTAMNAGIGNTVLHATSFDKPRVMDGVVYARYRPWMKKIGFSEADIDQRASSSSIKLVRIESQAMTFPFQFYNFMLGATSRITAGMADPMRRHRVSGAVALLGLGYVSLHLKKDGWWFDARSDAEVFQRVVDQSGIFSVYADLAYTATHAAIGTGMLSADDSLLKPKYNPTFFDAITEPLGAGPGMIFSNMKGAMDYMNGDTTEAAREFEYNLPIFPIISMAADFFSDD